MSRTGRPILRAVDWPATCCHCWEGLLARLREGMQTLASRNSILCVSVGGLTWVAVRSGKTTELLRRTRRFVHAGSNCLVIKFKADTRYSEDEAATHDGVTHTARSASVLAELGSDWEAFDVISIDEAQFFPDAVEFAEAAASAGKTVLVCGLDADFRRRPFGRILELVPVAEHVHKLTAVCASCGDDASFTMRVTRDETVEVIGGWEAYRPACRGCFRAPEAAEEAAAPVPVAAELPSEVGTSSGDGKGADASPFESDSFRLETAAGAESDSDADDAGESDSSRPCTPPGRVRVQGSPGKADSSPSSGSDPGSPSHVAMEA